MKIIFALLVLFAICVFSRKLDLEAPALDKDLINQINSNPKNTWKAGENDFFKNKTLRDVKKLLGSRKNVNKVGKVDTSIVGKKILFHSSKYIHLFNNKN